MIERCEKDRIVYAFYEGHESDELNSIVGLSGILLSPESGKPDPLPSHGACRCMFIAADSITYRTTNVAQQPNLWGQ